MQNNYLDRYIFPPSPHSISKVWILIPFRIAISIKGSKEDKIFLFPGWVVREDKFCGTYGYIIQQFTEHLASQVDTKSMAIQSNE